MMSDEAMESLRLAAIHQYLNDPLWDKVGERTMMTNMEMKLAEALLESNKRVVELMQVIQKLESKLECAAQELQDYSTKEFNGKTNKSRG